MVLLKTSILHTVIPKRQIFLLYLLCIRKYYFNFLNLHHYHYFLINVLCFILALTVELLFLLLITILVLTHVLPPITATLPHHYHIRLNRNKISLLFLYNESSVQNLGIKVQNSPILCFHIILHIFIINLWKNLVYCEISGR